MKCSFQTTALLLAVMLVGIPAQAQQAGSELPDSLLIRLRADALVFSMPSSTGGRELGEVPAGDSLWAYEYDTKGFWRITYDGGPGYIEDIWVRSTKEINAYRNTVRDKAREEAVKKARTAPAPRRTCCKICRKGKACGNSCIARNKTCRKGPGCACNG